MCFLSSIWGHIPTPRLTPIGLLVEAFALRISFLNASGVFNAPAVIMPNPPASETGTAIFEVPNPA
jgi:hypothetical protein